MSVQLFYPENLPAYDELLNKTQIDTLMLRKKR
jgi:hypothetical protein